eukprot:9758011-Karenia_brevis.AAC.1
MSCIAAPSTSSGCSQSSPSPCISASSSIGKGTMSKSARHVVHSNVPHVPHDMAFLLPAL